MNELKGSKRLVNTLTMVDGEVLPRLPERKLHPWAVLPDHQRGKIISLVPVPEAPTSPELTRLA